MSRIRMQPAPIPARGHVSDEITSLRVACLSIVSRPRWIRQRRVDDAFPRKQGKTLFIPSSACVGQGNTWSATGLGWGRNRTSVTLNFASTLALTHLLWGSKWELVRADAVIRWPTACLPSTHTPDSTSFPYLRSIDETAR